MHLTIDFTLILASLLNITKAAPLVAGPRQGRGLGTTFGLSKQILFWLKFEFLWPQSKF